MAAETTTAPGAYALEIDRLVSWVDTHCHLQLDEREPATLLGRAEHVDWLVAPGVDAATSSASIRLAELFPGRVLATAGLHPHDAARWPEESEAIVSLSDRVVAIGETGLDFYRNLSPRDEQIAAFSEQIDLAVDRDLPIIVHCRDAFRDVHEVVDRKGAGDRTVLHCWTGGRKWTKRFLELGVMFSFAGPLAFETGQTIRLAAELVPPDRAMVETDTPYLTPPPHRGQPNEPAWVSLVGEALAEVWSVDPAEAAKVTSANADRVFRS